MKNHIWQALSALFACVILVFAGCAGTRVLVEHDQGPAKHDDRVYERPGARGGPPPWAPAHGYRAKTYRYYPSAQIYYDPGRSVYFYYRAGSWEVSARLPGELRARITGDSVTLEMDTKRPYEYHSDVVRRYPPGQSPKNRGRGNPGARGNY